MFARHHADETAHRLQRALVARRAIGSAATCPRGAWKATEPSASIGTVPSTRLTPSDCTAGDHRAGRDIGPLVPVGVGLRIDAEDAQEPGLAAQLGRRALVDVAAEDHAVLAGRARRSAGPGDAVGDDGRLRAAALSGMAWKMLWTPS